jgi:sugar-phosphatase
MTRPASDALPLSVDGLLLDMDGTLIDSGPSVERSWARLFAEYGVERSFDHRNHGQPARTVLGIEFPQLDADGLEAAHTRIEQLEIEDAPRIRVLPGSLELIGELVTAEQELGRPLWTVVTSCTLPLFSARWAATGLPEPASVVTVDQVTRGKPHPEPFEVGAERLGIAPSRALVLEDAVGGQRAAHAAGTKAVALTTTTPAAELAPLADAVLESLAEVTVQVTGGALVVSRRGH